ncbi:hypothetical protein RDWZM_001885 [Blomia tropicalis]|uniref:Serpin domain-containing protein n=1 Tax=Blomia tropicalis TaxID=40697 RepID=A0A9Q0MGW9_BLOTA|nr:hypothetical protein RDWZM_001885 [Blomia tropicalis]
MPSQVTNDIESNRTIVQSINQFSFKLIKEFASRHQDDSKNLCFSPFEVFNSLVMLLIGAKGVSEAQLEDMLCLCNFNYNHDIMVYGSSIYFDNRVQIMPTYLDRLREIFSIKPKRVDFSKPEQVIKVINKDAHELTDGAIDGVVNIKDIIDDQNVRLVITNAVFFRGYWLLKFGDVHKDDFFYSNGTKSSKVDMMSHVGKHRYVYCSDLKAQAVSIAYAASEIRMVILLPDSKDSEAIYLVDLMSPERLNDLFKELQGRPKSPTELIIPRFALDAHKVSLQKSVKQMGARSIYEHDMAQLTGICANDRIHLTKLVHKAFILVDERGSFHSTNQSHEENSFMNEQTEPASNVTICFKANHPFMFIILDKDTGVICFMGILADPKEILEVVHEKDLSRGMIHELLNDIDNPTYSDNFSRCTSSSTA